jgi:hypothetical protein
MPEKSRFDCITFLEMAEQRAVIKPSVDIRKAHIETPNVFNKSGKHCNALRLLNPNMPIHLGGTGIT